MGDYSIDFAANAAGMTVAALVAARLAGRVSTRNIILVGQVAALSSGVAMLVGSLWFGTPVLVAIVCFFVLMTSQGLMIPNGGALASAAVPMATLMIAGAATSLAGLLVVARPGSTRTLVRRRR